MTTDMHIWLERLSTLHHSLIRKAVGAEGLQVVHFEILHYLSICNRYSNTAQAISEYFGQTKGSISQSLKFLEEKGYISRAADPTDKRYARLALTETGAQCLARMTRNGTITPDFPENAEAAKALRDLLLFWQKSYGMKTFGPCRTCQYNRKIEDGKYQCGLTGEALFEAETEQICREHEFA
ncbi:MAG TPA: MarR family winged helix-turn-helix transcriptional regulator [Micavibrio sp.]|jgi:DNA-binding MarR family transcriptional regulator